MKIKFLKHKSELIIGWVSLFIISILYILIGLIIFFKSTQVFILSLGIILNISSIIILFLNNRLLSTILITEIGIEWYWLKKQVIIINWNEINDIKATSYGRATYDLTIFAYNKKIKLELTKKIYNSIMILCPNIEVKNKINNLDNFSYLHKKNKKSPE